MAKANHLGKVKQGKDVIALHAIAYCFTGLLALLCLVPFLMVLAGSFSSEEAITANGFSILPQDFTPTARTWKSHVSSSNLTAVRVPYTGKGNAAEVISNACGTFLRR